MSGNINKGMLFGAVFFAAVMMGVWFAVPYARESVPIEWPLAVSVIMAVPMVLLAFADDSTNEASER